jgi:hypothetical protein
MNRVNGFKLGSFCKGVLAVSGHRYDPLSLDPRGARPHYNGWTLLRSLGCGIV